jgi:hypothetical protein
MWVDLLRANCLLLQGPRAPRSVSVSRAFPHGKEEEREAVISLAQDMAGEYGLKAEIERRGHFVTITFLRPQSSPRIQSDLLDEPRGKRKSLLERLISLRGQHRETRNQVEANGIEERQESASGVSP